MGNIADMARKLPIKSSTHAVPGWAGRTRDQRRQTGIKAHRKAAKLKQWQVAEALETSKATISRIENGELPYHQDFLELFADLVGKHPSEILLPPKPAKEQQ